MAELTDTQRDAVGRLSETERARLDFAIAGRAGCPKVAIPDAVELIVREHVTAALDEIENRIDQSGVRNDSAERWGIITALHIVRGYRQEQDR